MSTKTPKADLVDCAQNLSDSKRNVVFTEIHVADALHRNRLDGISGELFYMRRGFDCLHSLCTLCLKKNGRQAVVEFPNSKSSRPLRRREQTDFRFSAMYPRGLRKGTTMIDLDSSAWKTLNHAYGSADDIPELLRALQSLPNAQDVKTEPYHALWSSLCHQGTAYDASYAASPHLIEICAQNTTTIPYSVPQLVVCIEISRLLGYAPHIPAGLKASYTESFGCLPGVMADVHAAQPSEHTSIIAAAAFSAYAGLGELAEAQLELTSELAPKFRDWVMEL